MDKVTIKGFLYHGECCFEIDEKEIEVLRMKNMRPINENLFKLFRFTVFIDTTVLIWE